MARTPLFDHLVRAFRLIRRAKSAGVPPAELAQKEAYEKSRRSGLDRRQFLGITAAAATVPILATGCNEETTSTPDPNQPPGQTAQKVAIIGGGIAGLHCAYRLKKRGILAKVYEAQDRVGGRMYTDRTTFAQPDGQHCELGGELIDTGHQTMLDLATELGIDLLDYDNDDQTLAQYVAHIDGVKLTEQEVLDGFTPIAAKIDEALATLTDPEDIVYYNNDNGGAALDAMSISAWLDSIDATGPVRKLLEVAYTIEYGLDPGVSNILNLMFLISTDTTAFEPFGVSDERFHTKDGNDTFITKLAAGLDTDQVQLGHRLESLRKAADGRYTLTFANGTTVTAEHVVLALPFSILRKIEIALDLPPAKKKAIAEMGYGTNTKLMAGFTSKVWRDQGSNGEVFSTLPLQSTWETSRLQNGTSGIITNFTGGKLGLDAGNGTPEAALTAFLDGYDQIFPGVKAASNGKVARFHWPKNEFVLGSYSAYLVGQYTTITGSEVERFENVHFCGEHTSIDAQGYMEGGALTGAMAAEEVAKDLGAPATTAQGLARQPSILLYPNRLSPADRIQIRALITQRHRRWRTALLHAQHVTRKAG